LQVIDFHNHHIPARFEVTTILQARLSENEQKAITAGNCRRLLGID